MHKSKNLGEILGLFFRIMNSFILLALRKTSFIHSSSIRNLSGKSKKDMKQSIPSSESQKSVPKKSKNSAEEKNKKLRWPEQSLMLQILSLQMNQPETSMMKIVSK